MSVGIGKEEFSRTQTILRFGGIFLEFFGRLCTRDQASEKKKAS